MLTKDALSTATHKSCRLGPGSVLHVNSEQTITTTARQNPIISIAALSTTYALVRAQDKNHNHFILPAADGETAVAKGHGCPLPPGREHVPFGHKSSCFVHHVEKCTCVILQLASSKHFFIPDEMSNAIEFPPLKSMLKMTVQGHNEAIARSMHSLMKNFPWFVMPGRGLMVD